MVQIQDLIISKEMKLRAIVEQEVVEEILQPISTFKIDEIEECFRDVFIEEILPRLPANRLQAFKSVCKNWFRIISSPCFASLHLKIYNESQIRVLMPQDHGMMIEYKYNSYCDEETNLQIPYPLAIRERRPIILGSCNGLLCLLRILRGVVVVYNPSTCKYFGVQPVRDFFNVCVNISWFGEHFGEYVLVLGDFNRKIGVYKFNCSSKLELIHSCGIDHQAPLIQVYCSNPRRGTLLHGSLHWPAEWNSFFWNGTRYVICAYHLQENKIFEISPPVQCDFKLGVVQGCLFAIFKPTRNAEFEMWIMKEYGVQQSWTKYANIHGFNRYHELSPLGFFPNGDLMLDVDEEMLIKYSFNDDKAVLLMNRDSAGSEAIMCTDSLVCPTIVYR